MILSFRSKQTEALWRGDFAKGFPTDIQHVARRKLRMLNSARTLEDLRVPPANRFESLRGDRKGRCWRIDRNAFLTRKRRQQGERAERRSSAESKADFPVGMHGMPFQSTTNLPAVDYGLIARSLQFGNVAFSREHSLQAGRKLPHHRSAVYFQRIANL